MRKADLYALDVTSLTWHKSSRSLDDPGTKDCVEVADLANGAKALRDSKNPGRADLRFTASEWRAFVAGVRNDEFN